MYFFLYFLHINHSIFGFNCYRCTRVKKKFKLIFTYKYKILWQDLPYSCFDNVIFIVLPFLNILTGVPTLLLPLRAWKFRYKLFFNLQILNAMTNSSLSMFCRCLFVYPPLFIHINYCILFSYRGASGKIIKTDFHLNLQKYYENFLLIYVLAM